MLFGVNGVATCVSKLFSAKHCSPCQGPQSESTGVVLEWPLVHNSLLFKGLGAIKYSVNVIHTRLYSFELTCISTVLVSFVNVYLLFSWYNSFPGGAYFSFFYYRNFSRRTRVTMIRASLFVNSTNRYYLVFTTNSHLGH